MTGTDGDASTDVSVADAPVGLSAIGADPTDVIFIAAGDEDFVDTTGLPPGR